MRKLVRLLLVALGAVVLSQQVKAGPVVAFILSPADGFLAGQAGTSVGWGFSISTDSDYVTIESIAFGDQTPVGLFSTPGLPSSVASFGTPISTTWIPNISGLQYDIAAASILGASTQGVMTLTYDVFTDPGLNNQTEFGDVVNAQFNAQDVNAEVLVNAAGSSVPEPAGIGLALLGLAALCCSRYARTRPRGTAV